MGVLETEQPENIEDSERELEAAVGGVESDDV